MIFTEILEYFTYYLVASTCDRWHGDYSQIINAVITHPVATFCDGGREINA
jgi:hypothetical protein